MTGGRDSGRLGRWAAVSLLALAYILGVARLLQTSYDVAGGVLVGHVLAGITIPALLWLTRHDDRSTRRLILAALGAKLVGTLLRFTFVFSIYREGDATDYDEVGRGLAELFRHGQIPADLGDKLVGTKFIEVLTGAVYTLIGPTTVGGFLFFSWLGFWGLYLFYRAFRTAVPEGDHRRYGILIFFLPSMVFWPSSIGKDAWMALTLGLLAYGAARMLAHRRFGLLCFLLGAGGTALVRPHITITAVAALTVAYMLAGSRRRSYAAPLSKLAGMTALAVVCVFAFAAVSNFFKLDEAGGGVEAVLDKTAEQTRDGGSEYTAPAARSPAQLPLAVFSVLFRPLPWEAANLQALFASLEGSLLLGLFLWHIRRLRNFLPRHGIPYLTFVAVYSGMFAIAFSNISNFGILARQRVQLLPFLLAPLATPLIKRAAERMAQTPSQPELAESAAMARASGRLSRPPARIG